MFSPGQLTASHPQNRPLQGFTSHVDFENECSLCHAPLRGATSERCLACHILVDEQVKTNAGLHGNLSEVEQCRSCHFDHQGREVRITRFELTQFPHWQATGFGLAKHLTTFNEAYFECADCHTNYNYSFEVTTCGECHTQAQPNYMVEHRANVGDDCLACHDGSGRMSLFNHNDVFPLEGSHAATSCVDCHVNNQFQGLPHDCTGCHADDDPHKGELGFKCNGCHVPITWNEVELENHPFPIDHRNGGNPIDCQVCHLEPTFTTYTCLGCHEHNPLELKKEHREVGLDGIQNCLKCHSWEG